MKQNKLSLLESQLDAIDKNETAALRLGSCRSDDNAERLAVLSEIDIALSDYGVCYSDIWSMAPKREKRLMMVSRCVD